MTLAKELRKLTDEVIMERVKAANQNILDEMQNAAKSGDHYVIYPITALSEEFINYLNEQGLKFYGRFNSNSAWHPIYPTEDSFSMYNRIMIAW